MTIYSLNRVGYTFILYSIYFGFVLGDILTIWNPEYYGTFYFFGVPVRDIVLILVLLFFLIDRKMIFSLASRRFIFLYLLILIYYTFQGIMMSGFSGWTRADLRYFLWFLGGICFGTLIIRTGEIKKNLERITVLTALFMLTAALLGGEFRSAISLRIVDYGRILESGVYNFGGLLYVPLILSFTMKNGSRNNQIVPLAGICILFLIGVILTNTRSMGIILVVVLLLYILSFGIENNGVVIEKVKAGKQLLFAVAAGIVVAFLFVYALSIDARLERMLNISGIVISEELRYLEAVSFYGQGITDNTLFFGKGLGGTVVSPVSDWDATGVMHIGILNFWMKMGLAPFIMVSVYLFIILPCKYIAELVQRASVYDYAKTADLVVLPSLFPWIMNLAMSGGFAPQDSIFVGVAYVIHREISIHGLRRILN